MGGDEVVNLAAQEGELPALAKVLPLSQDSYETTMLYK